MEKGSGGSTDESMLPPEDSIAVDHVEPENGITHVAVLTAALVHVDHVLGDLSARDVVRVDDFEPTVVEVRDDDRRVQERTRELHQLAGLRVLNAILAIPPWIPCTIVVLIIPWQARSPSRSAF